VAAPDGDMFRVGASAVAVISEDTARR